MTKKNQTPVILLQCKILQTERENLLLFPLAINICLHAYSLSYPPSLCVDSQWLKTDHPQTWQSCRHGNQKQGRCKQAVHKDWVTEYLETDWPASLRPLPGSLHCPFLLLSFMEPCANASWCRGLQLSHCSRQMSVKNKCCVPSARQSLLNGRLQSPCWSRHLSSTQGLQAVSKKAISPLSAGLWNQ